MFIILLVMLVSIIAVIWIYFKIHRIAVEKNLVDNPEARKLQKQPVPVLGGIVVFFGVVCGLLVGCFFCNCTGIVPVLLAMSIMIYVGATDDILGISPVCRLCIECFAIIVMIYGDGACIDSLHGLWGITQFSWWIAVPLTVFIGAGVINAINMTDGVNGLSSGICVANFTLFGLALHRGADYPNTLLAFAMVASLIPFMFHNVIGKTSKMFLGDAGTMSMGMLMAWFLIQILRSDSHARWAEYEYLSFNHVALTMSILSVPVFDSVRVMLMRIYHGVSPFHPDKTHLHHVLFAYSQSHSLTSLIEIIMDLSVCGCWLLSYKLNASVDVQFYVMLTSAIVLIWGSYFFLTRSERKATRWSVSFRRDLVHLRQGEKRWWQKIQEWVDDDTIGNWGLERRQPADSSSKTNKG